MDEEKSIQVKSKKVKVKLLQNEELKMKNETGLTGFLYNKQNKLNEPNKLNKQEKQKGGGNG